MQTHRIYFLLLGFTFVAGVSCRSQKGVVQPVSNIAVAFPGAEGFGKYATGGRGGRTFIVTNLNDDGPGSLREAATARGKRMVVFAVSGTIQLLSPLAIRGHVTLAGQTAPGDGICIADHPVTLNGDNIIVRYMRFRLGDRYQDKGKIPGGGHDDAFNGIKRKNIIIDHCSFSWSTDECMSIYDGDSTTLQWNIISEPLNYSYHFEEGDKDFQHHGYGGIWGGRRLSAHHNLFAHCVNRNPRFAGIRSINEELVDYRNNVIYNWGTNNIYGGEGGKYNLINNYFKYGPSTSKSSRFRIVSPSRQETPFIDFGKFFVQGNFVDGATDISTDNIAGVEMGNGGTEKDKQDAIVTSAFFAEAITTHAATDAFEIVMKFAGASFPQRDTLDQRIVENVRNRTGKIIDVQGNFAHGTHYELTKHAWPFLNSATAPTDADKDGMPDDWERKNGLDPMNASDGPGNRLHNFFTNLEVYINSLTNAR